MFLKKIMITRSYLFTRRNMLGQFDLGEVAFSNRLEKLVLPNNRFFAPSRRNTSRGRRRRRGNANSRTINSVRAACTFAATGYTSSTRSSISIDLVTNNRGKTNESVFRTQHIHHGKNIIMRRELRVQFRVGSKRLRNGRSP